MVAHKPSARLLRSRLLKWFDQNQRKMPWRNTKNPYRIWLSEIMLQQTRVTAVIPYYRRFLRHYPTVQKLARARSILKHWAGLGYYSRARNLHKAAKVIVKEYGGRFPRKLEDALQLPGVGDYTARAVLSIAYGQRLAVVDGNVARVLIRLHRIQKADPADRSALQPLADNLLSPSRPGDFNQAMMELGSTVCLPRRPRCEECPLENLCAARQAGVETKLPRRIPKNPRPRVTLKVLVVERGGKALLVREPAGYFSGLWHFPYTNGRNRPASLKGIIPATLNGQRPMATVTHETTMRDLVLRIYRVPSRGRRTSNIEARQTNARWVRLPDAARLGVGAATRKVLVELRKDSRSRVGNRAGIR
jgi:A/G-specific adenine glycosylase